MLHEIVNDLNKSIQELFPMKKASCIYHYTSINVLWEFLRDESDFYCTYFKALSDPTEFQTGIFAIARIAGWSAHRIEELMNSGKIIRPAYKNVIKHTQYIPLSERE